LSGAYRALAQIKKKAGNVRQKHLSGVDIRIIVGTATCGVSAGAREVVNALNDEVRLRSLKGVVVSETGCSGRCDLEPLVQVLKDKEPPVMYHHVDPEKARRIVQQHVQNGEVIQDWAVT
jgi:NADP-reducing hydrogenase subunit HndB